MSLQAPVHQEFTYGEHSVKIESGHIALQATSTAVVTMGDCVIMANITHRENSGQDFFPLAVHYSERAYAAGKIPGSFNRREGRPSTREVLICRVIDRAIRPMFADGFCDEVQVTLTLLQNDKNVQPDIAGFIAVSAALAISKLPFEIIGAARVGHIDGALSLNPSLEQTKSSRLDLIIAGTKASYVMVESSAKELTEDEIQQSIAYGQAELQAVITAIEALRGEHKPNIDTNADSSDLSDTKFDELIKPHLERFEEALIIAGKIDRNQALKQIRSEIIDQYKENEAFEDSHVNAIDRAIFRLKKQIIRQKALKENRRIDGRSTDEVRPITVIPGFLSKTHGSALFIRGETQALVTTTLSAQDSSAQLLDDITSSIKQYDNFMLHYNMPGYSVGECGQPMSPKRREIGHGELAKKALLGVMPTEDDDFSYVVRVVSEILSCNGSSSMATICGASLSLMDAGVQIKSAVAGIAMGLIKEQEEFKVLSDILGDEDAFGDMDFKVAGTANGITALQMDIKINGITDEILEAALKQAKEGRLHILSKMNEKIATPRAEISSSAPRVVQFSIPVGKIREVIGRGGATIREIIDKFSVTIDISDDGVVKISSDEESNSIAAKDHIEDMIKDVEIGKIYEGKITDLLDFGAKVAIMNNKEAFLHISQISHEHIDNIRDELSQGQVIKVRVAEIDRRQNRIKLSMKDVVQ
ncbi:MAG: polyribonucleotide nucleotidyltransferase [Legionellales bacterium]|nr:polyribonucleotide nucleotidyltransferase [Legionellales bacterium]|tara:strand:+ start:710 stop:2815 length:2106 start_codon:yes stop_codon:yes gene_type:complete